MSFFSALGNFYGARQRAKALTSQRQFQNREMAQNDAQRRKLEAEQTSAEAATQKAAHEARLRARGIDPTTGKPFLLPKPLQQVVPGNKGVPMIDPMTKKPYVGGASPDAVLAHEEALARYYASTGQTPLANVEQNQVKETLQEEIQKELRAEQMAALDNRIRYENQNLDLRSGNERFRRFYEINRLLNEGGNAGLRRIPHVTSDQADAARSAWYTKWNEYTHGKLPFPKLPQGPGNLPLAPIIPSAEQGKAGKLFSLIDAAPNPEALAEKFAAGVPNPLIKALLLSRGRVANMEREAQRYSQALDSGGSTAAPPFPGQ